MEKNKEKENKTERISINISKKEMSFYNLVSDNNSQSENNKSETIYQLLIYGTAYFIKWLGIESIKEFKKDILTLKINNEVTFKKIIDNFYNKNMEVKNE